jgi:hypothetical protein
VSNVSTMPENSFCCSANMYVLVFHLRNLCSRSNCCLELLTHNLFYYKATQFVKLPVVQSSNGAGSITPSQSLTILCTT